MSQHSRTTTAASLSNEVFTARPATRMRGTPLAALCAALVLNTGFAAAPEDTRKVTYTLDIPSQSLTDALQALALVSHHKLLYAPQLVDGKNAPALKGEYTLDQAVRQLLDGTRLTYELTSDGLVLIRAAEAPAKDTADRTSQTRRDSSARDEVQEFVPAIKVPEILVTGSRITNVDIVRTENDVQPYTIITAERIQESGAATVEEFLKRELTMDTTFSSASEVYGQSNPSGTTSAIMCDASMA